MKWLVERLIVSWGIALLLVTGASAQAVVQGVVQPDEALAAERRAAERTNQPWSVNLGASEFSETNTQPGAPANAAVLGSELDAALARTWTFRRKAVTLNGNASEFLYDQHANSLNQFFYGVGVNASYAASPRAAYTVSDTLVSSYAQDLTTLTDSGLLPPRVLTRINTATTGLSYDLSPRTHIRWGLTEQSLSVDSSQFAAASTLGTSMSIGRQISRSQTLGVMADYSISDYSGTYASGAGTAENAGLLGTWQQTIGHDVTVNAAGGMRPYTLFGQSGFRIAPAASFGLHVHLRRSDTLGLRYERSVEQGLGNGTLLTQVAAADYGVSLGRRLALAGGAGYFRGADPAGPTNVHIGQTGNVSVRYILRPTLTAEFNYSLYVLTNSPNPNFSSRRAAVSLRYGRRWR